MTERLQTTLISQELVKAGHTSPTQYLTGPDVLTTHSGVLLLYVYPQGLDVDKLRQSYQQALSLHHVFTGRMQRDAQGMDMWVGNDTGASFKVWQVKGALPPYGPQCSMHPVAMDFHKKRIMPWHVIRQQAPLCSVGVFQFEDGGTVLSFNMVHTSTDATTYWNFMTDWSRLALGQAPVGPVSERSFLYELSQQCVNEPYTRDVLRELSLPALGWNYARLGVQTLGIKLGVYRIHDDIIQGWRQSLPADTPGRDRLSAVDLVTTHALKRMAEVQGHDKDRRIGMASDLRYRKGLGVPMRMMGCALGQESVVFKASEIAQQSEAELALKFRQPGVMHSMEDSRGYLGMLERQRVAGKLGRMLPRWLLESHNGGFIQNTYAHLPVYDIDFGSGKPSWFHPMAVPFRMVKVIALPTGPGGVDVHITASPKELAVFDQLYGASPH
jgi:shikimate O-hydroxycinnamoyltransferase